MADEVTAQTIIYNDNNDTPLRYQDLVIGCTLAICGNLLISISLNLQKYTHVKDQESNNSRHYLRSPLWWLGIFLMVLGELGNFSAYGFAPASLVAPLGTTTVVANMVIAVLFLKEKLRPEDQFGCTFAVVGAFLLVNFSQKDEAVLDAQHIVGHLKETAFIIYVVIEILLLGALFIMKYKFKFENVLVLLLITSLLASFTVIAAKAVSGMIQLTFAGHMQLQYPIFWIMVVIMAVTAVAQIKYLNQAMKLFYATIVVPTNFVFFTVSAILAGIIFYKEFWGMSALDIVMFIFGCLMCFGGVYFITAGRTEAEPPPEAATTTSYIPPPTGGTAGGRVIQDLMPTWLLTSVNRAEVQPRRDPHPHAADAELCDDDNVPIISREMALSTDLSQDSQHSPQDTIPNGGQNENGGVKSYGSTGDQ